MGFAESLRDVRRLLVGAAQEVDLEAAVGCASGGGGDEAAVRGRAAELGGDASRGGEQVGAGAARGRERDHAGVGPVGAFEALGEVADAVDLGAAERVDRLVGVADDDEVAAAAGEELEQLLLGGVGVLVLVDEHDRPGLAFFFEELLVGAEEVDGGSYQLGGVEGGSLGPQCGDGFVLPCELGGGDPVVALVVSAELGKRGWVDAALGCSEQEVS